MRVVSVALAISLALGLTTASYAHGGGGGGGHGGGHYTYVPMFGMYGGGISVAPPPKVGDYTNIKTVAVISAIGQKLTLGVDALFGIHRDIDVSDWKIDDFTKSTVACYMSERFTVKDIPYDVSALAAIPNNHFDTTSEKAVDSYLAKLPSQGIDAFIVIRPDSEGTAPPTAGLSFDDSHNSFTETSEIANYEMDVVDARTRKVISHSMSRLALREKLPAAYAAIKAPAGLAALTEKDNPTDSQRLKMKQEYTKLMALSLLETVRSLNFGIPLPDVGGRILVPITPDAVPPNLKTVAVASAIGDTFAIVDRHTFGGVAGKTFVPITDWQVDTAVENLIRSNLSKRLVVKDVPIDHTALANARIDFTHGAPNNPIPGLQTTNDVDFYLVIVKHEVKVDDPVYSGLGVFGSTGLFGNNAMVYVGYDIALVDPHTLKPVFAQLGVLSPKWPMPVPIQSDGSLWPKSLTTLTPEESTRLHRTITPYLDDSIPEMLLRLHLTDRVIQYIPGVKGDDASLTPSPSTAAPTASTASDTQSKSPPKQN